MTGWLLVGAVLSFTCQAEPIGADTPSLRAAQRLDGAAPSDFDRRFAVVGEAAQEVRRTGAAVAPSLLGIDEGFLNEGSLLHNEQLRDQLSERVSWNARPGSLRNVDTSGPDIFRETIDGALRATRDAFFEGGDTASFSLAGIDLNVTLRGERRGVSINGYDVLASNQQGSDVLPQTSSTGPQRTITGAPQETAVPQYRDDANDKITIADIRKLLSEPITIAAILAFLGISVVLTMASSRAQRD